MDEKNNYSDSLFRDVTMNIDELEKNVEEYPFSSLSNYLLLRHYKKTGHVGFEKLAKRTALYFSNYHWLQFQLSQIETETTKPDFIEQNNLKPELQSDYASPNHFAIATEEQSNNQTYQESVKAEEEKSIPLSQTEYLNTQSSHENKLQDDKLLPEENSAIPPVKIVERNAQPIVETIAFEPLHTVDYFASQGIKISDEALTNDKLGNQMKSFTEWLKSMKKLHESKLPEHDALAENIIQSAAEMSNINTEVLTEAMAEVLIKQDKKEKAIEMYDKLSLINPSKSAYFAAKIESIKSS